MSGLRCYEIPVCLLLLALSSSAAGQSTLGTITGLVTDSSHAVIPGAKIIARNVATGSEASTTSSSTGNYVVPNLAVGAYQLSVTQAGFKNYTRTNIGLSSGATARVG